MAGSSSVVLRVVLVMALASQWARKTLQMGEDFEEDYEEDEDEGDGDGRSLSVSTTATPVFSDARLMDMYDLRDLRAAPKKPFAKLAQGKYLLFYIPGMLHCDYARYQIQNDDDDKTWRELSCSEAAVEGWMWTYPIEPERWNLYRVFDKLSNAPILYDKIYSLPETAPPLKVVQYSNGPGWVFIWVRPPRESHPNLLGYKVRYKDDLWASGPSNTSTWKELPDFGRVRFYGKKAQVFPFHPCPNWPKSNMFCILFTDEVTYIPRRLDRSDRPIDPGVLLIHIRIKAFRFPYPPYARKYGPEYELNIFHNDCKIYEDCPPLTGVWLSPSALPEGVATDIPMDPMFDEFSGSDLPPPEYRGCGWEDLWIIFLCLCLFVLLVLVPIVIFLAKKHGHTEADQVWIMWAEGPGNVGIGLGYTAIAWEGERPPWKAEKRAQAERKSQKGYK